MQGWYNIIGILYVILYFCCVLKLAGYYEKQLRKI
jgi:hypothetical protein